MSRCQVLRCRHPDTHNTNGHKCGKCGGMGHGLLECGNRDGLRRLRATPIAPVDTPCDVPFCRQSMTHTCDAHNCATCGTRACREHATKALTCPTCMASVNATASDLVYTSAACILCYNDGPCLIFRPCMHANVCLTCATRM